MELDVNVLQCDSKCRVVTVDLGSVYKTQEGDPVYWLEKAEVMQRNKWELIIAMEFGSGLKGTVKSEPFRVTTKASYKMRKNGGWYIYFMKKCMKEEQRSDSFLKKKVVVELNTVQIFR